MTVPRRILAWTSYVVARRCLERRFYFMATEALVSVFKDVLVRAADTLAIELQTSAPRGAHRLERQWAGCHRFGTGAGACPPSYRHHSLYSRKA